jgi:leucyl-tRNA synthetase
MLAPFVPFLANELHEQLTGQPAEDATWPEVDPQLKRPDAEAEEELVRSLAEDVREVIDVTGEEPDVVRIYLAAEWKGAVYETVVETGPDVSAAMSAVMEDPAMQARGDAVADLVKELVEFVREHPTERVEILESVDEAAVYGDATDFLAREFEAEVELYAEDGAPVDPAGRAEQATPFRPAIHLE